MTHIESQAIFLTSFFLPGRPGTLPPGFWRSRKKKGGSIWLRVFVFLTFTGIAASAAHGQEQLVLAPATANFGNVEIGSSKTIQVVIKNTSSMIAVVMSENLNGEMYTVGGITPPMKIAPGANVVMSIKFEPTKTGSVPGSLVLGSGIRLTGRDIATGLISYSLSGTGVAAATLDATPINVAFGNVPVGTRISKTVQVMNYGTRTAVIASASVGGAGFSTAGLTLPMALAAGSTKSFTLQFAPTGTGTNSGTIKLKTIFGGNGLTLNMSGTGTKSKGAGSPPPSGPGVSPATHSVALSWHASPSSDVIGYNVYRATSPSTTYGIVANCPAVMNYTDGTAQAGQTYTYVVTAVDSVGMESAYSAPVTAAIP